MLYRISLKSFKKIVALNWIQLNLAFGVNLNRICFLVNVWSNKGCPPFKNIEHLQIYRGHRQKANTKKLPFLGQRGSVFGGNLSRYQCREKNARNTRINISMQIINMTFEIVLTKKKDRPRLCVWFF